MNPLKLSTNQLKENQNQSLQKQFGSKINTFTYPKVSKVVINVGVGKRENKEKEEIAKYLTKLTAQKPKRIASKKSIAGFKLRAGDIVGLQVTLRGQKAYDFILKLVYTALPRSRDFKGISKTNFDKTHKTYSLGIPSCLIFPDIGFEANIDFGLQTNIVFNQGKPENLNLLETLSFPFSKQ